MRYAEQLAEAGIDTLVGSVGDSSITRWQKAPLVCSKPKWSTDIHRHPQLLPTPQRPARRGHPGGGWKGRDAVLTCRAAVMAGRPGEGRHARQAPNRQSEFRNSGGNAVSPAHLRRLTVAIPLASASFSSPSFVVFCRPRGTISSVFGPSLRTTSQDTPTLSRPIEARPSGAGRAAGRLTDSQ